MKKKRKLDSFEIFATMAKPDYVTEEQVKNAEKSMCNGERDFKKEWFEECSYTINGDTLEGHFYLNNGEWFGDVQTKEEFMNYEDEDNDLAGMTCEEFK